MIFATMSKLLFAMIVGAYLRKADIINADTSKRLSSAIIDVTCPCLIISSVGAASEGGSGDIVLLLVTGAVTYAAAPFVAAVIVKFLHVEKDCVGVYRNMLMFPNNSFMGYPVVEALFGSWAVFYTTVFHMGYNVLFYSYGIFLMEKDAGVASKFEAKRLVNTGMIATVISLVICFANLQLPEFLMDSLGFVGGITTPLSMVIIGSNMAAYSLKDMLKEKKIYWIAGIRLLVIPALCAAAMSLVTSKTELISIAALTMGMPVGAMVAMGSGKLGRQGEVASISVVVTTLCSVVTIPIVAAVLEMVL